MRAKVWARLACLVGMGALATAGHAQVVISQVYGGGGNSGATYTNDFIELFNRGTSAVSLNGWSVQVTSGTGAFGTTNITPLTNFLLQPGQYYLIQEAVGAGGSTALPSPDCTGTIPLSATRAKVALCNTVTPLTGTCPTGGAIVDFVAYGNTITGDPNVVNCFEGAGPAPVLTNTTAVFRNNSGCTDTDNNGADFTALAPAPRNSTTATHSCASIPAGGTGSASPNHECPGSANVLTFTVTTTAGQNPASVATSVTGDFSQISPGDTAHVFTEGPAGTWTTTAFIDGTATVGLKSLPITINDSASRTNNTAIAVTVDNCTLRGFGNADPAGVCNGSSTLMFVDVTPASEPTSTGITVTADFSAIGGGTGISFYDDGTHGDQTAGDNRFSLSYTFPSNATPGTAQIFFVVSDGQGRSNFLSNAHFPISNANCTDSNATIVISQVYGGGGNSGGIFRNDFVELFNRSTSAVDISNWSIQRAAGDGVFSGAAASYTYFGGVAGTYVIQPGHYFLVQESLGADPTEQVLPTPDFAGGTITVSSTGPGTIALVSAPGVLPSCADATVVDLVGYGPSATCAEGVPAPTVSNPVGVHRVNNGCQDSNNNNIDFFVAAPTPRNNGTLPFQCHCGSADFNCDGDTGTDADIEAFFRCLAGDCPPSPCQSTADFNVDGDTGTDADIEAFFRVLAGGSC